MGPIVNRLWLITCLPITRLARFTTQHACASNVDGAGHEFTLKDVLVAGKWTYHELGAYSSTPH